MARDVLMRNNPPRLVVGYVSGNSVLTAILVQAHNTQACALGLDDKPLGSRLSSLFPCGSDSAACASSLWEMCAFAGWMAGCLDGWPK